MINFFKHKYYNLKFYMRNEMNYLTEENGARVESVTSEIKGCSASNLLAKDKKVNKEI